MSKEKQGDIATKTDGAVGAPMGAGEWTYGSPNQQGGTQKAKKGPAATHPLYDANLPKWQRCRVAVEGEDAVKDAGTTYLPRLGGQGQLPATDFNSVDPYQAYKQRALFYEAAGRTVEVLVGCAIRKPHTVKVPDSIELESVAGEGEGADALITATLTDVLTTGRAGYLVDMPQTPGDTVEPYISLYCAESIRNWASDGSMVALSETVSEQDPADDSGVAQRLVEQIRVLRIRDKVVEVQIYRRKVAENGVASDEWEPYGASVQPQVRGQRLDAIPFFWIGSQRNTAPPDRPPLLGLVNVNMSHYRTSADLEHGRHFTALPTPYVTGYKGEGALLIGSSAAWSLPDGATAGYLEFKGDGLGSLERALEHKEKMMANLGARLLQEGKKAAETSEVARIGQSGQSASLQGVVGCVEEALQDALELVVLWATGKSGEGSVEVKLNRDFLDVTIDAPRLTALVNAVQVGAISKDTFLWNLQQAEMLPPDQTIEDEKLAQEKDDAEAMKKMADQMKLTGGRPGGAPGGDPGDGKGPKE